MRDLMSVSELQSVIKYPLCYKRDELREALRLNASGR